MVISIMMLFVLFSAGSVLVTAFTDKKYGEILPLTCAGIMGVLFLFGLCGVLRYGVWVVILLCLLGYIVAFARITEKNEWHHWMTKMFTPAMVLFVVAVVAFAFLDRNKLVSEWDEFSHWADVVKAMVLLDDFVTNPASNSAFNTYPPGMALFQYMVQRVGFWLSYDDVVVFENLIFWSWKIFAFSWFFPFLERFSWKKLCPFLAVAGAVFLTPSIFYGNIYSTAYIDAFLGMVCAGGFAGIILLQKKDWCYNALILSACVVLVLSKDSGSLFAAFLAVAYIVERVMRCNCWSRRLLHLLGGVAAVVLPKVLWNMEIASTGATSYFPNSVNIVSLIQTLAFEENTYYWDVIRNYFAALYTQGIQITVAYIDIPYTMLFVVQATMIIAIFTLLRKQDSQRCISAGAMGIMLLMTALYIVGLCATYLMNFSQWEALKLASLSRYLNTAFLAQWLVLLLMMSEYLCCIQKKQWLLSMLGCVLVVVILPLGLILNYVTGYDSAQSQLLRGELEPIAQEIRKYTAEDDDVWFVSQGDNGYHYWITKYNVRPANVNNRGTYTWSMGEPFYEEDRWTRSITVEEWIQILRDQYDYVALYQLNDYFYEHYSEAFENADDISENAVYLVDKDSGLLRKCEE